MSVNIPERAGKPPGVDRSQGKILVVDDNPQVLKMTERILIDAGYEVHTAATGEEGLENIELVHPDMVLLDIMLPDLNGLDICRRVKSFGKLSDIYIVLHSASRVTSDDQADGLETGADGYIAQPIPRRELLARVATFMRLKRTEDALRRSVREKDVLLREINHRVKNNLSIVGSLMRIHAARIEDQQARLAFQECQNRIKAISVLHDRLYRGPQVALVDVTSYIKDLTQSLFKSYSIHSDRIALVLDINELELNLDQAVPVGLILNELVSNSLKHAFPEERRGEVRVEMKEESGTAVLKVSDDGVGLSKDPLNASGEGMGLQLVKDLARQLSGRLDVKSETGSLFVLRFPLSE